MVTISGATASASTPFALDAAAMGQAEPGWAHSAPWLAQPASLGLPAGDKRGALVEKARQMQDEAERLARELQDLQDSGGSGWEALVGALFGEDSGAVPAPDTPLREIAVAWHGPRREP